PGAAATRLWRAWPAGRATASAQRITASEVMKTWGGGGGAARIAARESEYPSSTADSANSTIRMAFLKTPS
ncbi:hypothetical protein, partial [Klebsiella pneumoniae]|uniref:hypothetical protein n=1 Tax=Klebsiella pneumoniae TaxID=573 RepID=UPI001C632CC5